MPTKNENKPVDRCTISFRPKKVNQAMNEMINEWKEAGDSASDKIIEVLIDNRKLNRSSQIRKIKSIFYSVYNSLVPSYEGKEEYLYEALDEVLNQVLIVNTANLFDLIQEKIDNKDCQKKELTTLSTPQMVEKQPIPSVTSIQETVPTDSQSIETKSKDTHVSQTQPVVANVNGQNVVLTHTPPSPKKQISQPSVIEESTDESPFNSSLDEFFNNGCI